VFVATALKVPPPGFGDLSVEEQISYVTALWDAIARNSGTVPLNESLRKELEERLAAHHADANGARPWSEVRGELHPDFKKLRR